MPEYYSLDTIYAYIDDSILAYISSRFASVRTDKVKHISTLYFLNIHAFTKNGKRPASSNSTASSSNKNKSYGVDESSK